MELNAHKEALTFLADSRIPKREISIALWARVISDKKNITYEKAYAMALGAGRVLAEAGYGRYIEGRRGRESRFKAAKDIKELALRLTSGASVESIYKTDTAAAPLSDEELRALRALIGGHKAPTPALMAAVRSIEEYSVEELLAFAKSKLEAQK